MRNHWAAIRTIAKRELRGEREFDCHALQTTLNAQSSEIRVGLDGGKQLPLLCVEHQNECQRLQISDTFRLHKGPQFCKRNLHDCKVLVLALESSSRTDAISC